MRSTTSMPELTSPSTAYCGGRVASSPVTMKNWLPEAPSGSVAVFAIATTPLTYLVFLGGDSVIV